MASDRPRRCGDRRRRQLLQGLTRKARRPLLCGWRKPHGGTEREIVIGFAGCRKRPSAVVCKFYCHDTRTFEVAARDGPIHSWSFRQVHENSLNDQICDYRYRLCQSGSVEAATSLPGRSWIKEFREQDIDSFMARVASEDPSPKLKVSFGELCFKLQSSRCHEPSISWMELQRLRNFNDFKTRWSNFCRRSNPSIATLWGTWKKGVEPRKSLAVDLMGYEGKNFDLKYHLVDEQWELHNVHGKRWGCNTYDVLLNNDVTLRLRAVTVMNRLARWQIEK